jgi:hypothetical protein
MMNNLDSKAQVFTRELSFQERCDYYVSILNETSLYSSKKVAFVNYCIDEVKQSIMDKNNVPTKLTTITYKDKTFEVYE